MHTDLFLKLSFNVCDLVATEFKQHSDLVQLNFKIINSISLNIQNEDSGVIILMKQTVDLGVVVCFVVMETARTNEDWRLKKGKTRIHH